MGDLLEAIAQAVGEVVGRENLPLGGANVLLLVLGDSVCRKIPHLRVGVLNVLLHAEERRLGSVLSIAHVLELLNVCFHVLLGVLAAESRAFLAFLSATLKLNLLLVAVADISAVLFDQLNGKVVELLEVVAGVCDFVGGEA